MPRIRTLKPEYWTDEKMSLLDPLTRLVFLALVSLADDAGRLIDNVKLLDGQVFPNTDDSCGESLDTLAKLSRIIRYRARSGQALIQIAKWEQHQKVDHPSKVVLPAPTQEDIDKSELIHGSDDPREILARQSRDSRASTLDLGPRTVDLGAVPEPIAPNGAGGGVAVVLRSDAEPSVNGNSAVRSVLAATADTSRRRSDADRERAGKAEFVFAYWAVVMQSRKSLFDDKRRRKIESALKENHGDVSELLYAIDGARKTPHLMGENEQGQKYNGIETVLRDRAQIEKLASKCAGYTRDEPHPRLQELGAA